MLWVTFFHLYPLHPDSLVRSEFQQKQKEIHVGIFQQYGQRGKCNSGVTEVDFWLWAETGAIDKLATI